MYIYYFIVKTFSEKLQGQHNLISRIINIFLGMNFVTKSENAGRSGELGIVEFAMQTVGVSGVVGGHDKSSCR